MSLYDTIYGCLAGSRIGSAMGAAVEGWSAARIAEHYGVSPDVHKPVTATLDYLVAATAG